MRPNINDLPNPFASMEDAGSRRNVINSIKLLLFTAMLLAMVVASSGAYHGYQLRQLSNDFANQSVSEKQTRLAALAEYGCDGVTTMVAALGEQDAKVAETAHRLLRELQNEWTVLPKPDALSNHTLLVHAIRKSSSAWASNRRQSAQDLLNQVIRLSVDQTDAPTRQLYFAATTALQSLSPSTSISQENGTLADDQLAQARLQPLPVTHLSEQSHWTDWPPRETDTTVALAGNETVHTEKPTVHTEKPTVHQAIALPLQAVSEGEIVVLRDVHEDRAHAVTQSRPHETAYHQPATIQPVAHIIEAPLQDADVATVIGLLDSVQAEARDHAASELSRRGFDNDQISVATQIASGDIKAKIALVDSISKSDAVDPRPWLLMLLDDDHREVRLRAISALAALKDPWVQQQLKLRMVDEQDQTVAFRIRRVLNLR